MADCKKLREAIKSFERHSRPSNATSGTPCTTDDINNVVKNVTKLFNTFVDELEKS